MKMKRTSKALLIILLIAALLRFIGTNPGYNPFHSDEGVSYSGAVSMLKNGNLDPLRYDYPAGVPLINWFFYRLFFLPLALFKVFFPHPRVFWTALRIGNRFLQEFTVAVFGYREVKALFWSRYITALFSLGNVFFVYLLGKKLFGRTVGLVAALFLAVNFRAVANSHIGLPDTYNAFFLLLALLADVYLTQKPNFKRYALAGVTMGLFFSIKYQGFIVLPFLLAHLYVSKPLLGKRLFLAGLLMVVVFVLLNPYFFINFAQAQRSLRDVYLKYSMGRNLFNLYPISYLYHFDYGPIVSFLVLLGFIFSLKRFFKETVFLLGFLFPFLFVMLYYSVGGFYVRNFITVTPLMLLFAAVTMETIFKKLNVYSRSLGLAIGGGLILAAVSLPVRNAVLNSYYYTKPWNYEVIVEKTEGFLEKGAVVASHPFDPLPKEEALIRADFERAVSYSLAEFREGKADFALINIDWAGDPFYGWMNAALPEAWYYWRKPVNLMRNSFWGLAIQEMMDYVLTAAYKPWQAPDAALYLIKVPRWKTEGYREIKKFEFGSEKNVWTVVFEDDSSPHFLGYDRRVGFRKKGGLKIGPGSSKFNITRYTSEALVVKPNHLYKVRGYLLGEKKLAKEERNGFLRVDFYTQESPPEEVGISVSVSPRYYGEDWQEVEILALAPEEAEVLRISFQATSSLDFKIWLDDVVVEESREASGPEQGVTKIPFAQYKDLLYPYSHGNL